MTSRARTKQPNRRSVRPSAPPPGRDRTQNPMPPIDFTTVVAEGRDIAVLNAEWSTVVRELGYAIGPPSLMPFPKEAEGRTISDPQALRVAVVRHPPGLGRAVATVVGKHLFRSAIAPFLAEPGFWLEPAGPAPKASSEDTVSWSIIWNADRIPLMKRFSSASSDLRQVARTGVRGNLHPTILLIDTGYERADEQHVFSLSENVGRSDTPPY